MRAKEILCWSVLSGAAPVEYPALSEDAARIAGLDGADRQAEPVWVVAPDPGPEDEGPHADEAPERDEPAVEVQ